MHPVFLKLGPLTLRWYGLMIAVGFLAAIWLAGRRARRAGLAPEMVPNAGFWMVLGGFFCARLLYVALNWRDYVDQPLEILRIDHGGIVYYGGFAGGVAALALFCRIKKLGFLTMADVFAPGLVLAHAFGRIGCFMNGCCWGKVCTLPWGVEFPPESAAGQAGVMVAVHPTQLYEAAFLFYLCFALVLIDSRKKFPGQTFASYGLLYSIFRFIVEFWRGDVPLYASLTVAQWISTVIFLVCWWWLTRRRKIWFMQRRDELLAEVDRLRKVQAEAKGRNRQKD